MNGHRWGTNVYIPCEAQHQTHSYYWKREQAWTSTHCLFLLCLLNNSSLSKYTECSWVIRKLGVWDMPALCLEVTFLDQGSWVSKPQPCPFPWASKHLNSSTILHLSSGHSFAISVILVTVKSWKDFTSAAPEAMAYNSSYRAMEVTLRSPPTAPMCIIALCEIVKILPS